MATLTQLLAQCRIDLDDLSTPYFWSDAELVGYINRAMDEVCFRMRGIRDSDSDLCTIRLRPGTAKYDLDCRILEVRRMKIAGRGQTLQQTTVDVLDHERANWEAETAEFPTGYLLDMDAEWVRVFPAPTVAKTVTMTVWRLPLKDLELTDAEKSPEINKAHHYNALEYAKSLAYSKHDADAFDPQAAALCEARFASLFGSRRSAQVTEMLRTGRSMKVRAHFR